MEIKLSKQEKPTKQPCLMENEYGEIFLVTEGTQNKTFVTRLYTLKGNTNTQIRTWESNLSGYKPVPKGIKIEITN